MKNSVSGGKTVYKRESTNSNNKANKNTSSINNDTNSNTGSNTNIFYRVRKSAEDAASQIGAFNELDRAKALADSYKADGYKVYDNSGNLIYAP